MLLNDMLECKGQDTIVLFGYKKAEQKGEYFTNISSKESLEQNNFVLKQNDFNILNPILGINNEDLLKLTDIRNKLKKKRLRN